MCFPLSQKMASPHAHWHDASCDHEDYLAKMLEYNKEWAEKITSADPERVNSAHAAALP